ncbi:hypothetical protein BH10PSE7_BH10PSE7_43130 [soil metagenome]
MNIARLSKSLFLAVAFLASGYSMQTVSAKLPPVGQGVVLVPPAKIANMANTSFKRGKIVDFQSAQSPGSIIIVTQKKRLYYVLGNGKAVQYAVATAKPGFEWAGTHKISAKAQWPEWRPPADMRKRRPELPAYMAGGPKNPLGARAMYLGSSIYRIHGTNEPSSIGKSASSGCIRMLNADVTELFSHAKVGATVVVM